MLTRSEAARIIALAWDRYRERKYQKLEDEHLAQWEYMLAEENTGAESKAPARVRTRQLANQATATAIWRTTTPLRQRCVTWSPT